MDFTPCFDVLAYLCEYLLELLERSCFIRTSFIAVFF